MRALPLAGPPYSRFGPTTSRFPGAAVHPRHRAAAGRGGHQYFAQDFWHHPVGDRHQDVYPKHRHAAQADGLSGAQLERHPAFPGDKVVLAQGHRLGQHLAAGHPDHQFQNFFALAGYGVLARDNGAGVHVDNVGHSFGQHAVAGDLERGGHRVASGGAQAGGEQDQVAARPGQGGGAFHVVAGGAEQVEAGPGALFGVVEHVGHGRSAALFGRPGRLDGIGNEAVLNVAGGGIHVEARAHRLGRPVVGAHEADKFIGHFLGHAAVAQFLLHAAQFGKLR
jgi:hypothetical protein